MSENETYLADAPGELSESWPHPVTVVSSSSKVFPSIERVGRQARRTLSANKIHGLKYVASMLSFLKHTTEGN